MKISDTQLRRLRNDIPIAEVAKALGLPNKIREDFFRFLCPLCNEFNTAANPKTNLGRCFRCERNFNPIDLVMAVQACSFREAVKYLEKFAPRDRQNPAVLDRR